MNIDYQKLTEITVTTQEEFDAIPLDFKGWIYVSGKRNSRIFIENRYHNPVVLTKNSSAVLKDNSSAVLWDNSSAVLKNNSSAELWDNSSAVLKDNSSAVLWGNSSAVLKNNSFAILKDNSSAVLKNNSFAVLKKNSSAILWSNSFAVLKDNSSAELKDNSSGDGYGNSQIVNQTNGKINIFGNARIVYNPKTIHEFMNFFDIKHNKKKAKFYKAVHYDENKESYYSDYDSSFVYVIGEVVKAECDPDVEADCSNGIHVSTQNWALCFGEDWKDLAILELETDIDKIVLPENSDGKVRTSEAKVIREIPLEECGLYGKILAKRRK